MKRNLTTRTIARSACTGLAMLVLAACSSSSSPSTVTGSTDGGGGGGGGSDVCSTIPKADVQALLAPTITSVTDNSAGFECDYLGGSQPQPIQWAPQDADKSSYTNLSQGAANDHAITGIGDVAFWNEVVPGQTMPQLAAHKGNATCIIQPLAPPDTTCKTTSSGSVGYTVADSDALAFVGLMGKVCNDVFAAL